MRWIAGTPIFVIAVWYFGISLPDWMTGIAYPIWSVGHNSLLLQIDQAPSELDNIFLVYSSIAKGLGILFGGILPVTWLLITASNRLSKKAKTD